MDYGKLAYLKIEDLTKQIDSLRTRVETAPYNCLSVLNKRPYYFEKSYKIEDYVITAKKQTILTLQYKVLLLSVTNETFNFSIYINNVKVETFTDYIGLEPKSFSFTIVAEGFCKGDNMVSGVLEFENSGRYNILCAEINATGNNICETVKTLNIDVLNKRAGMVLAVSSPDEDNIRLINQNFDYEFLSSPYLSFKKSGEISVVSNMFYLNGTKELDFYAYIDEKKLVINLFDVFSGKILDTYNLDSGITNVSACCSLNPVGLALAYIKNDIIYTCNITTDGSKLNVSPPKIFETIYGRVKKVIVFADTNNMANLFFSTGLNNGYLKLANASKSGTDYAGLFYEKTIGLGKCENIRFKPFEGKLIFFIKFKGAVYERVLENNVLSEPVLAAFCDELIPFSDIYIARKNNRLNLLR